MMYFSVGEGHSVGQNKLKLMKHRSTFVPKIVPVTKSTGRESSCRWKIYTNINLNVEGRL